MKAIYYLFICITILVKEVSTLTRSKLNHKIARKPLKVVEHLIDCIENKDLGSLYGLESQYCFQTTPNIFNDIKGLFDQLFQIGFIVITTLIIQRGYLSREDSKNPQSDEYDDILINPDNDQFKSLAKRCPQWLLFYYFIIYKLFF